VTLFLSDQDVRDAIDMEDLVDSIEQALMVEYRGGVDIVPRVNLQVTNGFFRLMPAVIEDMDLMGFKAFSARFPVVRYLIALFRPSTGELDCIIDSAYLTAARTGATTGVATRLMTGADQCREVGVIGSGLEARTNLEGVLAVRAVEKVKVFSPNVTRRELFAQEVRELHGIDVETVDTPEAAADAPCVIAATNTGINGPCAIKGEWLRSDCHVNTIGATTPTLHEADPETFRRAAAIVIDTEHAGAECGDIIAAKEAAAWPSERVSTLIDLLGSSHPSASPAGLTVFKSVGTAVQDLAAAAAVAASARVRGLGNEVDVLLPKVGTR
jgi:ornithine cyclodeaminase/alanine dehydrogenase